MSVANKALPIIGKAGGPGNENANRILLNQLDIHRIYNTPIPNNAVAYNHNSIL